MLPIFPELRPYLDKCFFDPATDGKEFVIHNYRDDTKNFRTRLERIVLRAGLKPWPKLFHNLRASRATELAAEFPAHVAAEWLGHSTIVASKHYWRTQDSDFEKALTISPELQKNSAAKSAAEDEQTAMQNEEGHASALHHKMQRNP